MTAGCWWTQQQPPVWRCYDTPLGSSVNIDNLTLLSPDQRHQAADHTLTTLHTLGCAALCLLVDGEARKAHCATAEAMIMINTTYYHIVLHCCFAVPNVFKAIWSVKMLNLSSCADGNRRNAISQYDLMKQPSVIYLVWSNETPLQVIKVEPFWDQIETSFVIFPNYKHLFCQNV